MLALLALAGAAAGASDGWCRRRLRTISSPEVIRRPRPDGYGVRVLTHIAHDDSFPSDHVVHAFAYVGFLLFLTLTRPRTFCRAPWLWPASIVRAALVALMGPSRLLEGEHWPRDVLGGSPQHAPSPAGVKKSHTLSTGLARG